MLGVGGWGLDTHPDRGRAPSGGECALPLVQLTPSFFPISPAQAHKHTTGTGINPREDHNRCTQQLPPGPPTPPASATSASPGAHSGPPSYSPPEQGLDLMNWKELTINESGPISSLLIPFCVQPLFFPPHSV